jgi:opacity protein-like surface antigen
MFKKALFLGLSGTLLIGAFAAPATAADGWYASGNVGFSTAEESSTTDTFPTGNITADIKHNLGYGISGAVGHATGPFRIEGELSYRKNDLDEVDIKTLTVAGVLFTNLGVAELKGDSSSLGFMANGYYDFNTWEKWTPFVMGGIGGAKLNIEPETVAGLAVNYDESDTVLAYQVGAGLGYNFSPKILVNLQYRYFGTNDPTFDDGVDKLEGEYKSHNFWIGLTQRF